MADDTLCIGHDSKADAMKRVCSAETINGSTQDASLASPSSSASLAEYDDQTPSARSKPALRLLAAASCRPRPDKADYGGEDSFFLCPRGIAVGVADGVSEWGWRFGINPRAFADELMAGARAEAERQIARASADSAARAALRAGFAGISSFGAATCLIASLDGRRQELGVCCIGDSGLRLLRRDNLDAAFRVVARSEEQLHAFNKPFQLSRIPKPEDFPQLLLDGKTALVQAVKRAGTVKEDLPDDALAYVFDVKQGDLLVLGSDGLFDNLGDDDLCALVAGAAGAGVEKLAERLSEAAALRAADEAAETPFAAAARRAGFDYSGGIEDDITVVTAWLVADDGGDIEAADVKDCVDD